MLPPPRPPPPLIDTLVLGFARKRIEIVEGQGTAVEIAFERYRQYVPIRQTVRLEPVRVRAGVRMGPLILTARRPDEHE